MAPGKKKQDALTRVLNDFEEARKHHKVFAEKCDKRYRAYRGIVETKSDANDWRSKVFPPYVLQIVETMISSVVDAQPSMRIRPRPKAIDLEQLAQAELAARDLQRLLSYQFDLDDFPQKQRPFVLQGLITGLTVGKTFWNYKTGTTHGVDYAEQEVQDDYGYTQSVPYLEEYEQEEDTLLDDPCFEVVDVRDFFWHEAATSLESADYVFHRTWEPMSKLYELEELGIFGVKAGGQPVDDLKESQSFADEMAAREQDLFNVDRTKDMVELLEYWSVPRNKRCVVANRKVLLAEGENPFWHKSYPFVVTSSMPDLFRIPGISEVEIIAGLQDMLWSLGNQRLDNLRLLNNLVMIIREGEDHTGWTLEPGAKWEATDPNAVKPLEINPAVAELSLQAEALIKGDLQNITGGMPFLSGTDSGTVDQETATGVSIVTNLAQRRLAAKKQQFIWAWKKVAEQFIALNQQFLTTPKMVEVIGKDGNFQFIEVGREKIQGRFDVVAELVSESLMRQEKRAEAQAKLQVAVETAQFMAATGTPWNLKAFAEDYLEAFDVPDKERYFSAQPQPALPSPAGGGGQTPPPGGATPMPPPQAPQPGQPQPDQSAAVFPESFGQPMGGGVNGP